MIKITLSFENSQDAIDLLRLYGGTHKLAHLAEPVPMGQHPWDKKVPETPAMQAVLAMPDDVPAEPPAAEAKPKRERKPRADKGQKREPYGPRTVDASAVPTEPTAAPAAADPAIAAPPDPSIKLEQVMEAMEQVFGSDPNKGTLLCQEVLQRSGVTRIRDLKQEQYAAVIADCKRVLAWEAA